MIFKKIYLYFILLPLTIILPREEKNKNYEFIEVKENITINWTRGVIYSEFSTMNPEYTKEKVYEIAYHNLVKNLLETYFESGKQLKEYIQNPSFENLFVQVKDKITIEKKIEYLNKKLYLLSFNFLKYYHNYLSTYLIEEAEFLPEVKKENPIDGIIIFVPKKDFKPSINISIYSSNGKLIYKTPVKKNTYFSNDTFLYREKRIYPPYFVYAQKIINKNDIILDHKDIEFLLSYKKIREFEKLKIVIYD